MVRKAGSAPKPWGDREGPTAGTQLETSATLGSQDLKVTGLLVLEISPYLPRNGIFLSAAAGESFQKVVRLGHPKAASGPSFPLCIGLHPCGRAMVWQSSLQ